MDINHCLGFGFLVVVMAWSVQTAAVKKMKIAGCGLRSSSEDKRIVYGMDSEHWPWIAGLYSVDSHKVFCAASLISDTWLLTASHCTLLGQCQSCGYPEFIEEKLEGFKDNIKNDKIKVVLGYSDLEVMAHHPDDLKSIQEVHIMRDDDGNPLFGKGPLPLTPDYDVALLKLKHPVTLEPGKVSPICLDDGDFAIGTDCLLIGWGVTEKGKDAKKLQKIQIPIKVPQFCEDWKLHMTDRLLCAGPADPVGNACWGDSGGPLQCSKTIGQETIWYSAGVVSAGHYGCPPVVPVLFAKTSDTEIRQWIKNITGI